MGQLYVKKSFMFLVMSGVACITLLPFAWMLSTSFKMEEHVYNYPIEWIPTVFQPQNYITVWTSVPFHLYYFNSLKVAVMVTAGQLITCSLAGYAFARLEFAGRDKLFLFYLATIMIPFQVIMIPQYFVMRNLGLIDSHWSLILMEAFSPFGVFIMRQFFVSISRELSEAARIDGSGEFQIFWRIILPLAKPAFATLMIFVFTWVWNEFQAPLIYLNKDELKTIPLGLASFQGEFATQYHLIMAGAVTSLIPVAIIFFSAQRFFISGLMIGAVKG